MRIYNTLTNRLDLFEPTEDPVTLYVCGITPYDTTHLGHAFTYTTADWLVRYLEFQGHTVRYVQNVTDIDDDILKKAAKTGEGWRSLVNRWTIHFIEDLQAINVRPPNEFPLATEVIPGIQKMVQELLEAGVAYVSGGSVYFDISAWPEYGKLSKLSLEEMLPIANERGNLPNDPHKRHPLDFVLWQAQAPGEPAWDSPWGAGRPGWHIECSTMSTCLLDETIDFHMGGADLVFPHHESEIAQVEPANEGKPFVRYWLHVAMVHHEGEKMSKSLGNLVMVRDLLSEWSPDDLRTYLASHHYRQPWSFDEARLGQSAELARRLRAASEAVSSLGEELDSQPHLEEFLIAMDNDLDTPTALTVIDDLAFDIMAGSVEGKNIEDAQAQLRILAGVLGLRLEAGGSEKRVITGWNEHLRKFREEKTDG